MHTSAGWVTHLIWDTKVLFLLVCVPPLKFLPPERPGIQASIEYVLKGTGRKEEEAAEASVSLQPLTLPSEVSSGKSMV